MPVQKIGHNIGSPPVATSNGRQSSKNHTHVIFTNQLPFHVAFPSPVPYFTSLRKAINHSPPTLKSAVKSLRIFRSSKFSSLLITSPFSFAKWSKQIKQYDVEISASACLGYADCKLLITSVNLSSPSSGFPRASSIFSGVGIVSA